MENKIIKEIRFGLENCESITVPYECFKGLSINKNTNLELLKDGDIVQHMEFDIKDNGKIEYGMTYGNNETYPLTRFSEGNDICHVDIVYEDESIISLRVRWYEGNTPYYNSNNNLNQTTSKLNYNEIHIDVTPYVQMYTIQEVFEFPVGTIVEMIDNGVFIIDEIENTKYFKDTQLTRYLVNGKYKII